MEVWKNILDGDYQISNYGQVKSNRRNIILSPGIAATRNGKQGYKMVHLKGRMYYIHRLVANMFIPNPEKKKEVNHIDGNKFNNNVENLEWVTPSENIKHAYKIGLKKSKGKKSLKQKENISRYKKVKQLEKETGKLIANWDGIIFAEKELKIDRANISACCRGKRKTAGGYSWKFVND